MCFVIAYINVIIFFRCSVYIVVQKKNGFSTEVDKFEKFFERLSSF